MLAGLRGYYLASLISLAALVLGGLWYIYKREKLSIFAERVRLWHEIRRHPAVINFALSLYLGVYLPVFIGLSRVAVHELQISPLFAAPVVWTGLELAQAHLLTGVNIATPGHSQYRWPELIPTEEKSAPCDLPRSS